MEHETRFHSENCFLTLTYRDEDLPPDGSLKVKDYQDFMKRFRDYYNYPKMKFYHCGEYGGQTARPHYHACFFGFDFADKKLHKEYRIPGVADPIKLYTSEQLDQRWGLGDCYIGEVNWSSAAYCARYVCDKITGPKAEEHYRGCAPEYSTMSKGIGKDWYQSYAKDLWAQDHAVSKGHKVKVPRYYEKILAEEEPLTWELIKENRRLKTDGTATETQRRLEDLEYIQVRRLELLKKVLP